MHTYGRARLATPTGPANEGTVTLFDSTQSFKGGLSMHGVTRVELAFPGLSQASATGGLIGYVSGNKGTTWTPCAFTSTGSSASLPATVAADTGSDFSAYNILVMPYEDVKFTFTAGATAPSAATWALVTITAVTGNPHSGV